MQYPRMMVGVVASALVFGLTGFGGDSPESSADAGAKTRVARAEEKQEEPGSGEVQERTVPRASPSRAVPAAPIEITPGVTASAPAFGPLPGEFAIHTAITRNYLTARDGGHHSIDAIIHRGDNRWVQ
jgi:hypothetical protein